MMFDVLAEFLTTVVCGIVCEYIEGSEEQLVEQRVGTGNIRQENNALDLIQRSDDLQVLLIVGVGWVTKGGNDGVYDEGEDVLELRRLERSVWSQEFEHFDYAQSGPYLHATVLVLEQVPLGQLLCKWDETISVGVFLLEFAQFVM